MVKKVDGLIKHRLSSALHTVKTKSGRSIRVTEDHCLFTLGKDGIEDVKISELVPGKSFIAIPQQIPTTKQPIYSIDLLDLLQENDYGLRVKKHLHNFP